MYVDLYYKLAKIAFGVWLAFIAYQPLLIISCQTHFYIYIKYMICKHIL